jgi:hypothetical protein
MASGRTLEPVGKNAGAYLPLFPGERAMRMKCSDCGQLDHHKAKPRSPSKRTHASAVPATANANGRRKAPLSV